MDFDKTKMRTSSVNISFQLIYRINYSVNQLFLKYLRKKSEPISVGGGGGGGGGLLFNQYVSHVEKVKQDLYDLFYNK